jgi:hypothetical protein
MKLNVEVTGKEIKMDFTYGKETYRMTYKQGEDNYPKLGDFVQETLSNIDEDELLDDDILESFNEVEEELFLLMDNFAYYLE